LSNSRTVSRTLSDSESFGMLSRRLGKVLGLKDCRKEVENARTGSV